MLDTSLAATCRGSVAKTSFEEAGRGVDGPCLAM
jgi:hypothetical protein